MDSSRDADLKRLHDMFEDKSKSLYVRKNAYRSFHNILRQVKDRKLAELRHRLTKAIIAGDTHFIEKIERVIDEYAWSMGYHVKGK